MRRCFFLCTLLLASSSVGAQPFFTDVTDAAGVAFTHAPGPDDIPEDEKMGTGAAWADFDGDGDLDLYVTTRQGSNRLYRNNGDGTFTDIAVSAGVADAHHDGAGVAVADYDNDGDLDLYLANSDEDVLFQNRLVETGTARFLDVTATALGGLLLDERGTTATWGDYDGDGFLDLYIAHHKHLQQVEGGLLFSNQDYLLHNNGDGTFSDASALLMAGDHHGGVQTGSGDYDPDPDGRDDHLGGWGFIGGWTDYDDDGDLDIFLVNDCPFGPVRTRLFRNDGGTDAVTGWTFTQVAEDSDADHCINGMGLAVGDYDRDLQPDLFYTNKGPALLLWNRGDARFDDQTRDAGLREGIVESTGLQRWSWGANFYDFDLDGWLDLFVAAGALPLHSDEDPQPNMVYRNNTDATFTDISEESGLNDPLMARTSIFGDYDQDGDPDLYLVNYGQPAFLYRNDYPGATDRHWLQVELEGTTSNRNGIGAKLYLKTPDDALQFWEVRSGSSLGGGDDLAAYFGLDTHDTISELRIEWPSGTQQILRNVAVDQRLRVVEEGPLPVELTSFAGHADGGAAVLTWTTATETGNAGFEIQHSRDGQHWQIAGWQAGAGTTPAPQHYQMRLGDLAPGTHRFRLRQVDVDGRARLSRVVEVLMGIAETYQLGAAYPNPFNPQTQLTLTVAQPQRVRAAVYDVRGREVAVLLDEEVAAQTGVPLVFVAADQPSGVYFVRVEGAAFAETRRVVLLK